MLKITQIILVLIFLGFELRATHILGGRIQVKHISGLTYDITVIGYRDHGSQLDFGSGQLDFGDGTKLAEFGVFEETQIGQQFLVKFTARHTYSGASRFVISYSEGFRSAGLMNLPNAEVSQFHISTELLVDPLVLNHPFELDEFESVDVKKGQIFQNSFIAHDQDGDILEFHLAIPSRSQNVYETNYEMPDHPKFYNNGDGFITLNKFNGTLEWLAPDVLGFYQLSFVVKEKRLINGSYVTLSSQMIDLVLNVRPVEENRSIILRLPESSCENTIQLEVGYDEDYQLRMSKSFLKTVNGINPELFLSQVHSGSQMIEVEFENIEERNYRLFRSELLINESAQVSSSMAIHPDCSLFEKLAVLSSPEQVQTKYITLFPNPARDYFSLETTEKVSSLRLVNLSGKEIYQLNVDLISEEIPLPSLESGLYLVQLFDEQFRLIGESKLQVVQ